MSLAVVRAANIIDAATTATINIPTPPGTVVGDKLILCAFSYMTALAGTVTPSGWTLLESRYADNIGVYCWQKKCTSTDISVGVTVDNVVGKSTCLSMYAIKSGGRVVYHISNSCPNSYGFLYTTGYEPDYQNLLILALTAQNDTGNTIVSTANNNPAWTQDVQNLSYLIYRNKSGRYVQDTDTGNLIYSTPSNKNRAVAWLFVEGEADSFLTPMNRNLW